MEAETNPQVLWQGRLDDQHTLRVERTGDQGILYVLTPDGVDLLVIGGIPLPSSDPLSEDDIAAWTGIAEKGIAELARWRTGSSSSPSAGPDESPWNADETRVLREMLAASHPFGTFTVKFEYGATGEGYTKRLLVVRAHTEAEALALFREHFHRNDTDDTWEYWRLAINVRRGLHREWFEGVFESSWLDELESYPYRRVIAFEAHFNAS